MEEDGGYYEKGLGALKAGDSDTAVALLEEASRSNPNDWRVFNALGAAYAGKKLYEKAIGAFKAAEQLAPGVASIHYNIAQAYEAAGIFSEADYEYEKALQIDPNYAKAKSAREALQQRMKHQ
jgi:Flp pilus assembly protein TadD